MISVNGIGLKEFKQGIIDKQTLSAASEVVSKGVYDATTLSAVDTDLAPANIKQGVTIFGKEGTLPPGGTETIEKYSEGSLASGATYTPNSSGVFFSSNGQQAINVAYYSTVAATWYPVKTLATLAGSTAIGDGTNFQIKNNNPGARNYCLMRHYYSTGTYIRDKDEQLAAGATYTPATAGFFADAAELTGCYMQIYMVGTWVATFEAGMTPTVDFSVTIVVGDGTNLRVRNTAGTSSYHVTMRTKLT